MPAAITATDVTRALYRKVSWHILLLPTLMYFVCALDISNISFAKLQMQHDIGISDAAYGLGASLFFIANMLFDIPSSLRSIRIGLRRTLSRAMALYGLGSIALLWISGAYAFALLRFLFGIFEAGCTSGAMAYFSRWLPPSRMGRTLALFSCAPSIAGIISGPLSAWIMTRLAGAAGLAGWKWLFLLQALLCFGLGILIFLKLDDAPASASWLSAGEKSVLIAQLGPRSQVLEPTSLLQVLKNLPVSLYKTGFSYFCLMCAAYTVMLWLPTLLREAGTTGLMSIGALSVFPPLLSFTMKIALGACSDRMGERRWHSACSTLIGAAAMYLAAWTTDHLIVLLFSMTCTLAFTSAASNVLTALCSDDLKGHATAGGIAFLGSAGMLGSFAGPTVMGWSKAATGSFQAGLFAIASITLLGAALIVSNRWLIQKTV
ncbi:Transporter, major facilitator family [Candidatus Glomeribacter gigasporarum BEG34]|uniref:Transporter, major facilitator family n=1 Tax=Candidatus Glomeribacter gigasporarum BEG34 TaxID=1070319 RepID=G2J9S0_9BURK|nr:MFS transporter [Candidatus Glomeribacter gigasporarum]CCD29517.1 Transporter, major facilitator family [Candidatus Glomeribacter gigasporarum BEG34]